MSGTSSTQTQQGQQQNNPYAPAVPGLKTALSGANAALTTSQANNAAFSPSNFVASFSPSELAAFQAMTSYGLGNNNLAPGLTGAGTTQLGAGTTGATQALSSLLAQSSMDPTASNMAAASAYANNPYIGAQVRNAMLAGTQEARDVTLPALTQGAAATGNINSSRVGGPDGGIAAGLVERGLAEQASGLYGSLASQAYGQGLNLAESAREANLSGLSSALGLGTGLAGTGVGTVGAGVGTAGNLYSLAAGGGGGLTAAQQAQLSNQLQQWQFGTSSPFASLQQFTGLVDPIAALGGSSTYSGTSTATPSIYQVIGGLLSAGGNFASGITGGGRK